MTPCRICGQEVIFRYKDGVLIPIHVSGECGGPRVRSKNDRSAGTVYRPCPECHQMAYFVKHNGGVAWVDKLGFGWPLHSCFERRSRSLPQRTAKVKLQGTTLGVAPQNELVSCPFCTAAVGPIRLDRHIRKVHKLSQTIEESVEKRSNNGPPRSFRASEPPARAESSNSPGSRHAVLPQVLKLTQEKIGVRPRIQTNPLKGRESPILEPRHRYTFTEFLTPKRPCRSKSFEASGANPSRFSSLVARSTIRVFFWQTCYRP